MSRSEKTDARQRSGGARKALVLALAALALGALAARPPGTPAGGAPAPASQPLSAPTVQAWSAVVMDRSTGVVLYAKSPNRHLPMASCTKVMTALLVLEKVPDLSRYARVPYAATNQRGASIGLRAGDRITIRNLLLGLMVRSATDCAVTLAYYVSGSEPAFARLMNRRAARMSLGDTHYINSSGIMASGHYTSARDLAELGRVAMRNARFRDLAWRVWATVTWPPSHRVRLHSHNKLNERYDWVDGIKTGSTTEAGACLVASGKFGLRRFIVTTLHEPTRDQEVLDALELFRYASSLYATRVVVRQGDAVAALPVDSGGVATAVAATTLQAVYRIGAEVVLELAVPASLPAAPAPGTVLGSVVYSADGLKLGRVTLVASPRSPSPSASPSP